MRFKHARLFTTIFVIIAMPLILFPFKVSGTIRPVIPSQPLPPPDAWEPNNTFVESAYIGALPGEPLYVTANIGPTEEGFDGDDFYIFALESRRSITVSLSAGRTLADIRFDALRADSTYMVTDWPIDFERVYCLGTLNAGEYFLHLATETTSPITYTLTVEAGPPGAPCVDPFEPNDSPATAAAIDDIPQFEAWLNQEDVDIYSITVPWGRIAPGDAGYWEITLTPLGESCTDVLASILDNNLNVIAARFLHLSQSTVLSTTLQWGSTYYLELAFESQPVNPEETCRYRTEHATPPGDRATLTPTPTRTPSVTPTPTSTPYITITPTPLPTPTHTPSLPSDLSLEDMPDDLWRRAAQLLEDARNTGMAPGWEQARLGPRVRALYRPDIEGPAYYEFQVLRPPEDTPAGFIVLATGAHDYPVAHWNFEGDTITDQMLKGVDLQRGAQGFDVRFYKLDTLAYAVEDANGTLLTTLGGPVVKVSGIDPADLDKPVELTHARWRPLQTALDDEQAPGVDGELIITGPTPPPSLEITGWESWKALKEGYAQTYGYYTKALREEAARAWQAEEERMREGDILRKGDVYPVAILRELADFAIRGEGASLVDANIRPREGLPPVLELTVLDEEPGQSIPFSVEIWYADSTQERIPFRIAAPAATMYIPLVADRANLTTTLTVTGEAYLARAAGRWSRWHYFWAGTHTDQRLYRQLDPYESPNTTGCPSGCGGTAWAMLFGWADYQAAKGNAYWQRRWGLYRKNGGRGQDAVAPRHMTVGVKNMTWEIRNALGTWCAFGAGPTPPWQMMGVINYLRGRTLTHLDAHWNVLSIHEDRLRRYAARSIVLRRTPAVIGTGTFAHYPLAYGYAYRHRRANFLFIRWTEYQRWFYVNQGWEGYGNGWIPASTWFAGEIYP